MLTKRFFAALAGLFVMGAAVAGQGGNPADKAKADAQKAFDDQVALVAKAANAADTIKEAKALLSQKYLATAFKTNLEKAIADYESAEKAEAGKGDLKLVTDAAAAKDGFDYVAPTSWTDKVVSAVDYLPGKIASSLKDSKLIRCGAFYIPVIAVLGLVLKQPLTDAFFADEEAVEEDSAVVAAPAA